MTVLVTGGAGYIGSHMIFALLDAGERPVVVDNLSTGLREAVPADVPFVKADIGDAAVMAEIIEHHRIGSIVHFAGSIVVPDSVADPLAYYLNNTVGSRALIQAAVAGGVGHFIFSSSAAVYGAPEANPISEDAPLRPISPYGSSKMMTEIMLRDAAAAHGISFAALRYFNVAGADPLGRGGQSSARATHLVKLACQAALGLRQGLDIYGTDYPTPDGTCIRDYIHVSDLAEAHLLALRHLRSGGDNLILNCGYGHGFSVLEVVSALKRVSGLGFEVRTTERRPGDPPALVADVSRIRALLGWRPRHDELDRIVAHALAWERRLQSGRSVA